MKNFKNTSLAHIEAIFPFKAKKGLNSFSSIEKVLAIKALFPNMETEACLSLFGHCDFGKYDARNIARLSDIENKGFNVAS